MARLAVVIRTARRNAVLRVAGHRLVGSSAASPKGPKTTANGAIIVVIRMQPKGPVLTDVQASVKQVELPT
jgi:hypothetical protein